MRALLLSLSVLGSIGCENKSTTIIPPDTGGASGTTGGGDDGGPTGTDEDGDSYTVEDGDCDDTDYQVNPAYPEDQFDGKDNDCDGRIDELWGGYAYAEQFGLGPSAIVLRNSTDNVDAELTLPSGVVPWFVTQGGDADWFTVGYPFFFDLAGPMSFASSGLIPSFDDSVPWYQPSTVYRLTESGDVAELATFGDADYDRCFAMPSEEAIIDCFGELDPRLYFFGPLVRGVQWHPDGWLAVLLPGQLLRVDADGSSTELGSWGWNYAAEEYEYELYGAGIAVDPASGTVGIAGLLGGFASWHADTGLVMERPVDLSDEIDFDSLYQTVGLTWMDGDGFYTISAVFTTGEYAIRRWESETLSWAAIVNWNEEFLQPLGITTNGDVGDWYVSSKAGQYRVIFRVRGVNQVTDDALSLVDENYNIWGLTNRY
jgi:hypothetical protein